VDEALMALIVAGRLRRNSERSAKRSVSQERWQAAQNCTQNLSKRFTPTGVVTIAWRYMPFQVGLVRKNVGSLARVCFRPFSAEAVTAARRAHTPPALPSLGAQAWRRRGRFRLRAL
jgi:hypothetical protein